VGEAYCLTGYGIIINSVIFITEFFLCIFVKKFDKTQNCFIFVVFCFRLDYRGTVIMKRLKDLFQFFITSVVDSEDVSHSTLLTAFVGLVLNQAGFDKERTRDSNQQLGRWLVAVKRIVESN
jgi:hypothetical protein